MNIDKAWQECRVPQIQHPRIGPGWDISCTNLLNVITHDNDNRMIQQTTRFRVK